jgi:hypothetical protein
MEENTKIQCVIAYCHANGLDSHAHLTFIKALRLPSSYFHLYAVALKLVDEYERARKFHWLIVEPRYEQELSILNALVAALRETHSQLRGLGENVTKYPLTAQFLSESASGDLFSDIFAVLKIYTLRLSLTLLATEQSSATTLSNMAADARQSFEKVIRHNYIADEIYQEKQSFVELLASQNKKLWELQKQFISWIAEEQLPATRAKPQRSAVLQVRAHSVTEKSHVLSEQKLFAEPSSAVLGTPIAQVRVTTSQSDEEDERLDEIFEYQADPQHPVSYDTAEQSLIYGSRLRVQERMLLSLRSNVFTQAELDMFISGVVSDLQSRQQSKLVTACCLLLMLLTARQFEQLLAMALSGQLPAEQEGIDWSLGIWRRQSIEMPKAVKPKLPSPYLFEHQQMVDLPMPTILIQAISSIAKTPTTLTDILKRCKVTEVDVLARLTDIMAVVPRRTSFAQVRSSLFQQVALKSDPGFSSLLFSTTEYITPTPLYYKSIDVSTLQSTYAETITQFGLSPGSVRVKSAASFTGSHLALNDDALAQFFKTKYQKLQSLSADVKSEAGATAFLNELACYTTLILLASTGHRTRSEFQFEPALIQPDLKLLLLADKIQYDDGAIRFVPLTDVAFAALEEYGKSARRLAGRFENRALKEHLGQKSNWQTSALDTPFVSVIKNGSARAISADDLVRYLAKEHLVLPLNFFRHRLCSRLSEFDGGDRINWLIGHVGAGEHPLHFTSSLCLSDISRCNTLLNQAIEPLAIEVFKSDSQRGLPANLVMKTREGYLPPSLQVKRMAFRERLGWARDLFTKFSKTLDEGETILDKTDAFISFAIEQARKLNHREDSAACMQLINRKLERYQNDGDEPAEQTWRMPLYEPQTALDVRYFSESHRVLALRRFVSKRIVTLTEGLKVEHALYEIVLSMLVQSAQHMEDTNFVVALQRSRSTLFGLHFFDFDDKDCKKRIYLDALTTGLIYRYPEFAEQTFSEAKFIRYVTKILEGIGVPTSALSSINTLTKWLAYYDVQPEEPGLLRSFRINALHSKPLAPSALARLLTHQVMSNRPVVLETPQQSAHHAQRKKSRAAQPSLERTFFNRFMKNVRSQLRQKREGITMKTVVPKLWQSFVGAKGTVMSDLLQASSHLSDAAVAVLVFMTDVGKRAGKNRDSISIRTMATYFSKTCTLFLDVAQEQAVFEFDEDELEDFYIAVLDSRDLKTRGRHADMLRDLHRTVEKHFYLARVSWKDIEPNINGDEAQPYANIITESEYQCALQLLLADPYATKHEQLIQAAILVLSYRAGLRRGEIKYRLLQDLCSDDGLLYISSNHFYRLKSINANRRIPKLLLLNGQESQILQSLADIARREYDDARGRVFHLSDSAFAQYCARVTEALIVTTEDPTTRLYDCRHSFASHLSWLAVCKKHSLLYPEISAWCRQAPDTFMEKWLQITTGSPQPYQAFKFFHTVSLVIGHSTPLTTVTHYVHEMSLFQLEQQTIYHDQYRHVDQRTYATWLEITQVAGRKAVSRYPYLAAITMIQRTLTNRWPLPEQLRLQNRSDAALSAKSRRSSVYEQWLMQLSELRKLVLSENPEKYVDHAMTKQLFTLFRNQESSTPCDLITPDGELRANRHLHRRVKKAVTAVTLPKLLQHLSKMDESQLLAAANLVIESYHGKLGYFFTASKLESVEDINKLGLRYAREAQHELKRGLLTEKGESGHFYRELTQVSDQLFVASLVIKLSDSSY